MAQSELPSPDCDLKRISVPERGYADISSAMWTSLQKSDDFRRLHNEGVFDVAYLPMGRIRLKGTCYVGHAICGDVLVDFREKIDGALVALLTYASHSTFRVAKARSTSSGLGELISLLVAQFLDAVMRYVSAGRQFSYSRTQAIGSLVGGRLNITKSIQLRARGLGHMLAFEKNTVTFNIQVNKVVLAALVEIERLSRIVRLSSELISRSRSMSMLFSDCRDHELLYRERAYFSNLANTLSKDRQTDQVKDILALAGVILAHESFDSTKERVASSPRTWFLNLENLFETAIRKTLHRVSRSGVCVSRGNDTSPAIFDREKREFRANPDLVVTEDVNVLAIGDVKYKVFDGSASSSDVYQLLAHTEAFKAKKAFLIFPDEQFSFRYIGTTQNGIDTWFFSVRVKQLEEDLREVAARLEIASIAEVIADKFPPTRETSEIGISDPFGSGQ